MRLRIFVLSVLLLDSSTIHARNRPEISQQDVTFCELAKNPSAFLGMRIRIRAIYSYMFEVSRLKSQTCCPESEVPIWVDFDEELAGSSKKLLHKFPKGMGFVLATFAGRLESGRVYGPFGERFRLIVDKIEKVEQTTKSPAGESPTWVPKNCKLSSHVVGTTSSLALDSYPMEQQ
jgi:hypothetical protein